MPANASSTANENKATEKNRVTTVPIDTLTLDPSNPRSHPERSQQALAQSIKEFGAGRSVVVDSEGIVRAGNGTLEAARAAGFDKATIIETDGKTLVVVKRSDWTPEQAAAYAIADNRTGELSNWDYATLSESLFQLSERAPQAVEALGFTFEEIKSFLATEYTPPAFDPGGENGEEYTSENEKGEPIRLSFAERRLFQAGLDKLRKRFPDITEAGAICYWAEQEQ